MPTLIARYGDAGPEYTSGRSVGLKSGGSLDWTTEMLQRILDGEGKVYLPDPTQEVIVGEINKAAGIMTVSEYTYVTLAGRVAGRLREMEALGIPHEPLDLDTIRFRIAVTADQ